MLKKRMSSHLEGSAVRSIRNQFRGSSFRSSREFFANKATQTEYRESESQTLPWEPPYKVKSEENPPEVLTLLDYTWGHGLPAGMHELEKINRMRMRKAWEKILPPMDNPINIDICSKLLNALEADSWNFREAEIQFTMDMRMTLAEKLAQTVEDQRRIERENRFEKLDRYLVKRKLIEIKSIRNKLAREIRKLGAKRLGRRDSAKFNVARQFDLITPRYRINPAVSDDLLEQFESDDSPKLTSYSKSSSIDMRICPRLSKRDEKKLSELYRNLETIKANLELATTAACEPELDEMDFLKNDQLSINEGRNHYRELIERLESVRVIDRFDDKTYRGELKAMKEDRIKEIIGALEGRTIAKMLIFLNEELKRLQNEKSAHALALLAERKKIQRQRADSRRELDEMFRKILKINRDSVETYLEDIANSSSNVVVSDKDKYIDEMSDQLDNVENYLKDDAESFVGNKAEEKCEDETEVLEDSGLKIINEKIFVYAEISEGEQKNEITGILRRLLEDAQKNLTS